MECTFVEAPLFTTKLKKLRRKDLLRRVQREILHRPENGRVISGTGGIEKIRVPDTGKGKSGSFRVFYLSLCAGQIIHLIYILEKSESENISEEEKGILKEITKRLKGEPCS